MNSVRFLISHVLFFVYHLLMIMVLILLLAWLDYLRRVHLLYLWLCPRLGLVAFQEFVLVDNGASHSRDVLSSGVIAILESDIIYHLTP